MCCKSTKKRELGHKNRWIYFVRLPTFRIFVIIFVMKPRNTRTDMDRQPLLTYYDLETDVTAFSTTRHGGWSRGSYASLNINTYCGDNPRVTWSVTVCRCAGCWPLKMTSLWCPTKFIKLVWQISTTLSSVSTVMAEPQHWRVWMP